MEVQTKEEFTCFVTFILWITVTISSEVGRVSAKGEESSWYLVTSLSWMKTTNWSVNTLTYC